MSGTGLDRGEETPQADALVRSIAPASENMRSRLRGLHSPILTLLINAIFGGMTSVGLPVFLDAAGLSKAGIAAFFVIGSVVAVVGNLGILPHLVHQDYPAWAIRLTTAAVPVGTVLIALGAAHPAVLYAGVLLLQCCSMTVPQIFGRVARSVSVRDAEVVTIDLRQFMVIGYVLGLIVYSGISALGINAMFASAVIAAIGAATSWSLFFARPLEPVDEVPSVSRGHGHRVRPRHIRSLALSVVGALILVATMRGIDSLRGIYVPLFAVHEGIPQALVSPLFLATSVTEIGILPLLGRANTRWGPAMSLVGICGCALVSFGLVIASGGSYAVLLISQFVYSVFASGFQSIGMILLSRVENSNVGKGAAVYQAITQTGTVVGVTMPLLVPGYSSGVFVIATGMCVGCMVLSGVLIPWFRPTRPDSTAAHVGFSEAEHNPGSRKR